jgi:hypothetical protein
MRILICGGRAYDDVNKVLSTLDNLPDAEDITHCIHGGAKGADALAGHWARTSGVQEVICPADWSWHGTHAGPIRNRAMLALQPDLVVAFPGGKGTAHMVRIAKAAGVPVKCIS